MGQLRRTHYEDHRDPFIVGSILKSVPVNSINCFACSNDASSTAGSSLPSCADESSLAKIECSASKSCMETIETVNNVTRVVQRSCWSNEAESCIAGSGNRTVCTCLEDLCNCDKCEVMGSLRSSGLCLELDLIMSLTMLFMGLVLNSLDNFQTGTTRYHLVHRVLRSH